MIRAPSACVTCTLEIVIAVVIVASSAICGGAPTTLFTIRRAIAPAFCALSAFVLKVQVPRSTTAIFPATSAALVKAEQPSVVLGPTASAGSMACTIFPVMPGIAGMAGPKFAVLIV